MRSARSVVSFDPLTPSLSTFDLIAYVLQDDESDALVYLCSSVYMYRRPSGLCAVACS